MDGCYFHLLMCYETFTYKEISFWMKIECENLRESCSLRMVPPFARMYTFYASQDGPKKPDFLRIVPATSMVFLCSL